MSTTETDDRFLLVHAYCDGELDPVNAKAAERQISADRALVAERDRIMALRRALHEKLPGQPAPDGLRDRIEKAVGLAMRRRRPTWNALAVPIAAALVMSIAVAWLMFGNGDDKTLIRELTASHARALIVARVTDVNSSDQHTIKPWFSTRTAQALRIVDLTSQGFPLVGGRLDVIEKIPVPTLVYARREHFISLTEMPASATAGTSFGRHSVTGFYVIGWAVGDTSYWATSDVGLTDLELFVQYFRTVEREQ